MPPFNMEISKLEIKYFSQNNMRKKAEISIADIITRNRH